MGHEYDVIVVGAGNAALAASVAARRAGARRVLVMEKAPREMRGGNTYYSGGLFRIAFESSSDLLRLAPQARELPGFIEGVEPYPKNAFAADLARVTDGRTDPDLSETLIARSLATAEWMAERGIRFEPAVSLGAVRVGGVIKWPRGAILRAVGEGVGLSTMWFAIAEREGVEVAYETAAQALVQDRRGRVTGVIAQAPEGRHEFSARAVILGCGGFEANAAWRAKYLGRPWDQAKVRGTPYNQGDGLRMALAIGAMPWGQWTGCHATPIDASAPPFGDRKLTDKTNRLSYPYGVMLNREGRRFVDEGEDQQFFTYARFGGVILAQPGGVAFQIFDDQATELLEPRYRTAKPIMANTLTELVEALEIDRGSALKALTAFNSSRRSPSGFNPGICDGLAALDVTPPKSNWARPLEKPPFRAYPVTGGITFSFGGVKIDTCGRVVGTDWRPIPGLFACGEMVGGLFHFNYPGGSGLMSGAVFGRIAGEAAAGE